MRDEDEVREMADKATDASYKPKCFGSTYEEGVRAALDWVLDEESEPPIDAEEND